MEFTGGWIEEVGEVNFMAFDVLKSRIGRHMNKEYAVMSKILLTCNPKKNWTYTYIYRPWKAKSLPKEYCFIQALYNENPFTADEYGTNLKEIKDESTRLRLMEGLWEYDDDPSKLMNYDAICDLFTNTFVEKGDKYISSDLAGQGRDNFVISVWDGLRCKIPLVKEFSEGDEIEKDLRNCAGKESVPRSKIVYDSGGMGFYLKSYMKGIYAFDGATSAVNEEYIKLRSECYFKLAELVNQRKIYIDCKDTKIVEMIKEELEQIKRENLDRDDQKKKVISKEKIKENLGRSPDFADVLMMRMVFIVQRMGGMKVLSDPDNLLGLR